MSDEQIGHIEIDFLGISNAGVLVDPKALIAYARLVIAEYERLSGIAPAQGAEPSTSTRGEG